MPKSEKSKGKLALKFVLISVIVSVIYGVSYLIQLVVAENVPAILRYPLITGGSIIFTALLAWAVLREKPNRRIAVSLILCMIGCCIFI